MGEGQRKGRSRINMKGERVNVWVLGSFRNSFRLDLLSQPSRDNRFGTAFVCSDNKL